MAVNQQLKDYIDQQTKAGVSKDAIKSTLVGAGWQATDVAEAMGEGSGVTPAAAVPSQPKAPSIANSFEPGRPAAPASKPFVASDIFQPKTGEPVFQPRAGIEAKPISTNNAGANTFIAPEKSSGSWLLKYIIPETIGVLALVFISLTIFLYMKNGDLEAKLKIANQGGNSSQALVESLTKERTDLTAQVASLTEALSDLSNQLSLYAVPANATKTQEYAITLKGLLTGGGKLPYALVTNKDIVVTVKNSTDPKVDAVLKPLVNTQIEISGTHLAHSDSVTVTSVNGTPINAPAPAPTSTAPAATTTTP